MGLLDDVLSQAAQGGNNPLMSALNALLVGTQGGPATSSPSKSSPVGANTGAEGPDGGLAGGLNGLLETLKNAGHSDTVNSWVGPGPNKPIQPEQLGSALGQKAVVAASQQSGLSEQELLAQLAQNLPQIIDKLTTSGTIPSLQQVAAALTQARK